MARKVLRLHGGLSHHRPIRIAAPINRLVVYLQKRPIPRHRARRDLAKRRPHTSRQLRKLRSGGDDTAGKCSVEPMTDKPEGVRLTRTVPASYRDIGLALMVDAGSDTLNL